MKIMHLATVLGLTSIACPAAGQALDCVIEPKAVVSIAAQAEGVVADVFVQRGDKVVAGTPVLKLEDRIEALQLDLASALATSDIELVSEQERLVFRQKELERVTELASRNVATQANLDDAMIEVRLSELAIDQAAFSLERARIEQSLAAARLERRTLTAPLEGFVISVDVAPGEYADQQTELIQIAVLDPLHVEVFMPARFYGRIVVGDTYLIRPMEPLTGEFAALVSVIDPVFDTASGTFGMRLTLPNPDGSIPAGIRCQIEIPLDQSR